jgi:hypothetical protein
MVSTRELGRVNDPLAGPPNLCVWKYDLARNAWQKSNLAEFQASDDSEVPTNIFVHGNWLTLEDSVQVGFIFYRHQAQAARTEKPLRMVIWSWPSAQANRPLRDVRAKYARTDTEAVYLASFLQGIGPQVKVSLVGYSFGAPIITGALHHVAADSSSAKVTVSSSAQREPFRAVLIAAAEDRYVLSPGGEHSRALTKVDQLLVIKNRCDPALKWFRFIDRCARPEALGYCGACGPLGEQASKLRQVEAAGIVGKEHNWRPYFMTPSLVAEVRPYVWWEEGAKGQRNKGAKGEE